MERWSRNEHGYDHYRPHHVCQSHAAASVAHKSNIHLWVIWDYEYWHQQCLEAVFEVCVTTVEVEIVLELLWGKLSLFSFQHVMYYRRAVSHEWTVILWLYEIHAESWEHEPITTHELVQTNTSFWELSRHNWNNGSIYRAILRWALFRPPPAVLTIDHTLFLFSNTFWREFWAIMLYKIYTIFFVCLTHLQFTCVGRPAL